MRNKLLLCIKGNGKTQPLTIEKALARYPRQFARLLAAMGREAAKPVKKVRVNGTVYVATEMFSAEEIPEVKLPTFEDQDWP